MYFDTSFESYEHAPRQLKTNKMTLVVLYCSPEQDYGVYSDGGLQMDL